MDKEIEKIIISEYKKGLSSLKISDKIKLSKPTVLKVLRKHNLIRQRDRCSKLKIDKIDNFFVTERVCPKCNMITLTKSKDKIICCRNHYKKINNNTLCKSCSLELQVGEGNPFYGKKHNKETKKKISKGRKGKGLGEKNSMAKNENREKVRSKFLERIISNPINYKSRSKDEIKIYEKIKRKYPDAQHTFTIKPYICDIFIPELNLILEYNGDYWHCNPNKYDKDFFNKRKNKTANQIWEYDKNKIDFIVKNGYTFEVIWESDFRRNPKIIDKLLKKYVQNQNLSCT